MKSTTLKTQAIAERIQSELLSRPIARLPTFNAMARTYDVSRRTICQAIRLLCEKGLLQARPGRGTTIVGASTNRPVSDRGKVLEAHLRVLSQEHVGRYFPSVKELCRTFQTSDAETRRIVERLRAEGVLSVLRGRRCLAARSAPNESDARNTLRALSEERLYHLVRTRIESGDYRTGQPLPKMASLASTEHVAMRTILRVYRRLVRDGLAFRQGRTVVPGQSQSADGIGAPYRNKCIMIVQPNDATWDEFAVTPWTMPFAYAFMREMSLYGIEPVVVPAQSHSNPTIDSLPAARMDDRLLGILVVNRGWASLDIELTRESLAYAERLCRFGKRVVFFDHLVKAQDEWLGPQMRAMLTDSLGIAEVKRHFTRCYLDGFAGTRLAVSSLRRLGHRTIGYPVPGTPLAWMSIRRDVLRDTAAQLDSAVHTLDSVDCPPLFNIQDSTMLSDVLSTLSSIERPFARSLMKAIAQMGDLSATILSLPPDQKQLFDLTACLGSFVKRPDLTAIIAPNDELARMFYRWFHVAGIRIPQDLSLLSFDDRVESSYPYTISSINFGFDNLGFTAFHAILGDIPVKTDKWLSVAAKCRINHYATIGRAVFESDASMMGDGPPSPSQPGILPR